MAKETVQATSGDVTGAFELDWDDGRWNAPTTFAEGDFPFVATVRGKRYELYSDGTFNEQELP